MPSATRARSTIGESAGNTDSAAKRDGLVSSDGRLSLEQMSGVDPMVVEDAEGGLSAIDVYMMQESFERKVTLTECFALALTDECSRIGLGKVYIFTLPMRSGQHKELVDAFAAFEALARLIYIPQGWTNKSRAEWQALSRLEQLHDLESRRGLMPLMTAVLPFCIVQSHVKHFILPGFAADPITVNLTPQPHVGETSEFRKICNLDRMYGKVGQFTNIQYSVSCQGKDGFGIVSKWKVEGLNGIVKKLDEFYADTTKDHAVLFGALMKGFASACRVAAEANQHYGIMGDPTLWNE